MRRKRKIPIFTLMIATGVAMFVFSPHFWLYDISVQGNLQIDAETIIELADIGETNFFLFRPAATRRNIIENHFIEEVNFVRTLPTSLQITVRERFLSGYIEYLDGLFLYIDENGRILDIRSYMDEEKPIITGLRFSQVHLGELLSVENPNAFAPAVAYTALINRHNIHGVSQIDVSDHNNVRLRLYNIEVQLGDLTGANEKILTLREIVEEWPTIRQVRGFLDLSTLGSTYVFRILT
ncbi:MAG: FtsQ-type POTRA domain-containing protein [Turicibacter sp.]|nr:FtsQ-type POTRA domain-containing protein [Turicibacter sp.]